MRHYIFIVGGVMSGIGKGITSASLGNILQGYGYRVAPIKIDPYLNVDAGTMNPIEHGEVFVTEDGIECDQDIGNYERFLDQNMFSWNYMTSGSVYGSVISKERNLEYGGKCVEVVPHIPEEVIRRIKLAGRKKKADFVLIEVGGTVGEYQNLIFLEAGRMMHLRMPDRVIFIMVSYLPIPRMIGEMKTKPTQHAVRTLNMAGIQPDIIIARSAVPLDRPRKKKIATFCNVDEEDVISAPDVQSIYEVPINFEKDKVGERILSKLGLRKKRKDFKDWSKLVRKARRLARSVKIGIVGKYFTSGKFVLADSYISVIEAVKHSAWHFNRKPEIVWLNAESYEKDKKNLRELDTFDGIIVPGGFGERGVEGKISAINYVRKKKIPFLGLCYGMQLSVVEFARFVARLRSAHTTEIDKNTRHPVVDVLPEQELNLKEKRFGGSMRLGAYPCRTIKGSKAREAYGERNIVERHRHRYEFNNDYREKLEEAGLKITGVNPQRDLVEIIEIEDHPFFMGTQFHPELKSRPLKPHPIFREFMSASVKRARRKK